MLGEEHGSKECERRLLVLNFSPSIPRIPLLSVLAHLSNDPQIINALEIYFVKDKLQSWPQMKKDWCSVNSTRPLTP